MKVNINAVSFDADKKLEQFVEQKVKKLERYYSDIVSTDVYLRLEKPHAVENKLVEIRLEIPGNDLFAKKQAQTFEEGVNQCVSALRSQLLKHKEKNNH